MTNAIEILRKCRITSKYKGYSYLPEAIYLYKKLYGEQIFITKDIYPIIARNHKTTVECVEHNLRTVIERCWINNKDYIDLIVGYKTFKSPTNMEFIDCVVYYLTKEENK